MEESLCPSNERSGWERGQGVLQGSPRAVEYRVLPLRVVWGDRKGTQLFVHPPQSSMLTVSCVSLHTHYTLPPPPPPPPHTHTHTHTSSLSLLHYLGQCCLCVGQLRSLLSRGTGSTQVVEPRLLVLLVVRGDARHLVVVLGDGEKHRVEMGAGVLGVHQEAVALLVDG